MSKDISFRIDGHLGDLSESKSGWHKEVNLISWNNASPKIDIRDWSSRHEKMGKGITLSNEEVVQLYSLLKRYLEK